MKQLDHEDDSSINGVTFWQIAAERAVGLIWRKQVSGDKPWKINFVSVPFLSLLLPGHRGGKRPLKLCSKTKTLLLLSCFSRL